GHVEAFAAARAFLQPERCLIIPSRVPPHKALAAGSPTGGERLELTRLAFAAFPEVEVSDMELLREGVSYTALTLEELHRRHPDESFFFLMGTDMFLTLESWYEYGKILSLCTPVVLTREEGEESAVCAQAERLCERYGTEAMIIPRAPLPMSSTELRLALAARAGRAKLPDSVYERIIRCRFYGAKPELDWLRERAFTFLKPKRVPHVQGCETMARLLARRWEEDEDTAAEAAILHDITKKLTAAEQLRLCAEYGIMTDDAERENTELLHAKTGAAFARALFGVEEAVFRAIFWHTTGRAGMSRLEKIIYLADAIEPTRCYDGVEALRECALRDLDEAMIMSLERTIAYVAQRGGTVHVQSHKALHWFLKQKEENKS
ncbi:MAG: bis(5'-nucleosyl)-tetraphosphatase (symmetrical) YqeK, partial [Oscillospiraceae bacterium]|nr:bis(5'-nucleosyl)-tetraphosphatase (symmetrical) YqeK [Oscillospiraceae bacterium]